MRVEVMLGGVLRVRVSTGSITPSPYDTRLKKIYAGSNPGYVVEMSLLVFELLLEVHDYISIALMHRMICVLTRGPGFDLT